MNRQLITDTLISLGTPVNIKGFNYIVDIIELLDRPEWEFPKWSALYYCVGNLHNSASSSVEKAIRNALRITRERCGDYKLIEKYIGFSNCENSNSLMLLYTKLKQQEKVNNNIVTKLMLKEALLDIINI